MMFRGHGHEEMKHQIEAERALVMQFKQAAETAFAEVGARCSGLEGLTEAQAEAIRSATAQTEALGTRYHALRHEAEEAVRRTTDMKQFEQKLIAEAAAQRGELERRAREAIALAEDQVQKERQKVEEQAAAWKNHEENKMRRAQIPRGCS